MRDFSNYEPPAFVLSTIGSPQFNQVFIPVPFPNLPITAYGMHVPPTPPQAAKASNKDAHDTDTENEVVDCDDEPAPAPKIELTAEQQQNLDAFHRQMQQQADATQQQLREQHAAVAAFTLQQQVLMQAQRLHEQAEKAHREAQHHGSSKPSYG